MFLRYSPSKAADQLSYVKNLGLNALRFEGNFPPDDMFDQMDRAGILAMAGWQCCDRWENTSDTWPAELKANAANQAARVARQLRSHPSVFAFFQGSDYAPDPDKEAIYLKAFRAADWETPQIAAASYWASEQLGPSGSKEGSYNYAPPSYWWNNTPESASTFPIGEGQVFYFLFNGSAWGFESEAGTGNTIPTQDSLDRFLTPADQSKIWDPATATGEASGEDLFHTTEYTEYYKLSRLGIYNTALWHRYGPWSDMPSYQKVAQLGQYEIARAEFEAYIGHSKDAANPSTGLIYWMLNKSWPSLMWNLFGYDFDQPGGYFGAKKANEPLHILYAYDDGSVKVANLTNAAQRGLRATVELIDLDGTVRSTTSVGLPTLASQDVRTALEPQVPANISRTYFAKLTLARGSSVVSRNVYWLSTKPDVVDWEKTHDFQGYATFKPDGYADLTGLQQLGKARVDVSATTRQEGSEAVTTVTIRNVGKNRIPALSARADVFAGHRQVLPVLWSDNQLTLWPGEQQTITARYDAAPLRGSEPVVRLSGWNIEPELIGAG
jgi:exo-1,4-beta-D-glucosaminidase